jgi:hypothetical protein
MTDARRNWKIAGGMILAAAAGLPALAQDLPSAEYDPAESEPAVAEEAPAPSANGLKPLPAQPVQYGQYGVQDCPPYREGPIRRWRRRHKAHCQDTLWGYPEEFQDAPLGASVQANIQVQATKGQAARMVLYQYDFVPGSDRLKPRGKLQAVVVEPSGRGPKLDEARRQAVWHEFTSEQILIPAERVIVARPLGGGLDGPAAALMQNNLDKQTTARGVAGGTAGGSGAGGSASSGGGAGAGQQQQQQQGTGGR